MEEFEIVKTTMGATSIRNNFNREIMHNPVGPWLEANALYVEQTKLRSHLQSSESCDLVVFDVGLGAAANAIAALTATLKLPKSRRLHLVSFENNLALLKFALKNAAAFEHMDGFETALTCLLETHRWESPGGRIVWELRSDDFLKAIERELAIPEIVFYDLTPQT